MYMVPYAHARPTDGNRPSEWPLNEISTLILCALNGPQWVYISTPSGLDRPGSLCTGILLRSATLHCLISVMGHGPSECESDMMRYSKP